MQLITTPTPSRAVSTEAGSSTSSRRPRIVSQLGCKLRGLLGTPARHHDTVRVVRREICRDAASHGPVATGDKDVGVIHNMGSFYWAELLVRARSFPFDPNLKTAC